MAGERTRSEAGAIAIADRAGCLSEFLNCATPRQFRRGDNYGIIQSSLVKFNLGGRKITLEPAGGSAFQVHSIRQLGPDQKPGLSAFVTRVSRVGRLGVTQLHLVPEAFLGLNGAELGFRVDLPEPIGSSSRLNLRLPLDPLDPVKLASDGLMSEILLRSLLATKGGVFPQARSAWLALQANERTPTDIREMLERMLSLENWGFEALVTNPNRQSRT